MTQKPDNPPAMMTNEQLAEAVARVKELDAKRTQVMERLRVVSQETPHSLAHRVADDERHSLNVALQQHAPQMAAIIVQLWEERGDFLDERQRHIDTILAQRDVMRMARGESERIIALGLEPSELPDNIRVGRMFTISERIRAALDAALKGGE